MTFFKRQLAALALIAGLISSCKKDDADPVAPGPMTLHFENVVGSQTLDTSATYTNAAGEAFSVKLLQYYVSNIKLTREDGTVYTVPQDSSYFLVRQADMESTDLNIPNVPAGNYIKASFNLGVDSARSRMSDAQRTGVLNIADSATGASMYWSWNPGYIFYRLEGKSPVAPGMMGMPGGAFYYHIGGYGGTTATPTFNNNRKVELTFPTAAIVKAGRNPEAHILHDVAKALTGPGGTMSFAAVAMIHAINESSVKVADNYSKSFVVAHVHND